MELINILIVEDEFIIAEDAANNVEELGYNVIDNVRNYNSAIEALNKKTVDIALIDINLNDTKDGIDLATEIRARYAIPFIFVTSNSDKTTIERAKHLKPNGYLLKPYDKKDLYTSIEIALANYVKPTTNNPEDNTDELFIKDGTSFIKLKYNDIWFVKSDGNYVSIKTEKKSYLIRKTLKEFGLQLPTSLFFQVQKSYYINLKYIDSVNATNILLKGNEIPIGREFKEEFYTKMNL